MNRVQFSGKLICPIGHPVKNRIVQVKVDDGSLGDAGLSLTLAQNFCTWEGLQLGGQKVTQSVITGIGPSFSDKTWSAEGYDFGTLANGDHYLAQWKEKGDSRTTKGTWKLLIGTGTLEGIIGEATFEEPAVQPGDTQAVGKVTGWYQLPR